MAVVNSVPVSIGSTMPKFELKDPSGKNFGSDDLFGTKGLLVAFTCNHCPYAIAIWPRLIALSAYAKSVGINTVGINPNIHPDYPEDAPDQMKIKIKEWGIPFSYLVDEAQATARAFNAQCTPDLYLYDANRCLVYHGRFDDNWKNAERVESPELKNAVTQLAQGKSVTPTQHPSMGCSIKWRK